MKLLSLVERKKEKEVKKFIIDNKEALYRFAYTYVKNEDDALDIVHDAICKCLKNIDNLNDIGKIKSWIFQITSNTAIDYIRKNKKYELVSDDLLMEEVAINDEYKDIDLQRALERLPEKYRTIVILRYFEDMKISEIATVLDEKESTIKTRLYKALDKLKISIT